MMEFAKLIESLSQEDESYKVEVNDDQDEIIVTVKTVEGGEVCFTFDDGDDLIGVSINGFELSL